MSAKIAGPGAQPRPRRERTRLATVEEIKATAFRLMREQGSTDVRFADIARAMGVTGPALYRYFVGRDELLTALMADGYDTLGRCIAEARTGVPDADLGGRLLALARAFRDWARAEPYQFALVFGMPVPGYAAPSTALTVAADGAIDQLANLFVDASGRGVLRPPLIREVSVPSVDWQAITPLALGVLIPPESLQAMLQLWAMLLGFASLEVYGQLDWMSPEARDGLFLSHVRLAAEVAGLPAPPP